MRKLFIIAILASLLLLALSIYRVLTSKESIPTKIENKIDSLVEVKPTNIKEAQNFRFPVILDPLLDKETKIASKKWKSTNDSRPNYIGKLKDTIKISRMYWPFIKQNEEMDNELKRLKSYWIGFDERENYKRMDSSRLSIQIDTNQLIESQGQFAYPILISNTSEDTVYVGSGDHIPIRIEAKNRAGEWMPIEKEFFYFCGTGLDGIILPPNEILISSVVKYKGSFNTSMRIRMYNLLSKPFAGSINESQFEGKGINEE